MDEIDLLYRITERLQFRFGGVLLGTARCSISFRGIFEWMGTNPGTKALQNWPPMSPVPSLERSVCPIGISSMLKLGSSIPSPYQPRRIYGKSLCPSEIH
jgi:hypothetical protein